MTRNPVPIALKWDLYAHVPALYVPAPSFSEFRAHQAKED